MKSEFDFDGIVLSEYEYLIPQTDWHYHENPYMMYVLHGDLYDVNKKAKMNCTAGSLIFHNWQEPHYNSKATKNARGFHLEFESNWFANKQLDIKLWEGSKILENPSTHHILAKLYAEFKQQDAYSAITIELLLFELCENISSKAFDKSYHEPSWVNKLKEIIHEDEQPLSLEYLSTQLGVHPAYLSRAIPKYLSSTLGDYLRQQKIKKALSLMSNKTLSLSDIAHTCGFSDHSHFSRTFRTYINMSPKAYRNKLA